MNDTTQVNTNAVVCITLGIMSVLFFPLIGWVLGLIGLIFGNRSLREIRETKEKGENLAVVGKVCSIVGIALGVISIIFVVGGLVLLSAQTNVYYRF